MHAITAKARRKRGKKACKPCHQRKRRCDGLFPCGMCITYEYECSYFNDGLEGKSRVPASARPENIIGAEKTTNTMALPPAVLKSSPDLTRIGHGNSTIESPARFATTSSDDSKLGYAGASAATAFPHVLSEALGSSSTPKPHAFAYNFGTGPEDAARSHSSLESLISEDELIYFSKIYFASMAPITDYFDPKLYDQRRWDYYHGLDNAMIAFGAIAAGVAALGSFLSPEDNRCSKESELVYYAKTILEDPASMRVPSVDHIVGWAMRVFYLRATSHPENAWFASCHVLHLCEAVGLNNEDGIEKIARTAGAQAVGYDQDRLRRIFWITWSGHNILSYEYDRSPVQFKAATCGAVRAAIGSVADQFVQICQIIPAPNSPFRPETQSLSLEKDLYERVKALSNLQVGHPFLVMTKADLSFCFYRRIYQLKKGISNDIVRLIIDGGNAAVQASVQMASQGLLFWNVIGSVFHYICVLLAIDAPVASMHIGSALQGLEKLAIAANTAMAHEALSMAQRLINLVVEKKQRELGQLQHVQATYDPWVTQSRSASIEDLSSNIALEIDWNNFLLDPYLPMVG